MRPDCSAARPTPVNAFVTGIGPLAVWMTSRLALPRTPGREKSRSNDRAVMAHGAAREQVMVRIHRFQELRVGPAVMQTPALPVVPMTGSMGDALVGADFLRGRRVWLSFSTHRVFVTPLPQSAPVIAATSAD